MVRTARDRGIPVFLVAVSEPGLFPSAHPVYTEVTREFDLPVERDALADILTDSELKSDPMHPNVKGYARLAGRVAALLRKAKALRCAHATPTSRPSSRGTARRFAN
jgi:acyl-CoA thioesterase-1